MTSLPRKSGKPTLSLIELLGESYEGLEETAAKYRPTLEALGVLDGLQLYQEVMLFVWLWKHDRKIEDARWGIIRDLKVEWED